MSNLLGRIAKLPITLPLKAAFIRKRVAFELRPWFGDMLYEIPLDERFACPLGYWDSALSFSEIFVANEYAPYLDAAPLPLRWLDLGCHAGYFTLYLAWKNAQAGRGGDWSALMIDADPRMEQPAAWTLRRNGLERNAGFRLGMIAAGGGGERDFALREGMLSSAEVAATAATAARRVCRVPCVTAEEIVRVFPGPYDLVKIDIEGSEYDFMEHYQPVWAQARRLLAEWHSPGADGSGAARLRGLCAEAGFEHVRDVLAPRVCTINGEPYSSGVHLYARRGTHEADGH